jgi:glutamate formiminotransferase
MARKKVFVSFDYDHDADIKMFLVNQSKLPDAPFDIWDSSVNEHIDGDWEEKVKRKIRGVDVVCVLCGEHTHTAKGVAIELKLAKEVGASYFLLKGYSEKTCTKPTTATSSDTMYKWTWENLKALIHGNR